MSNWTIKEKSIGDLTVTIEGDEWKAALDKAFNKLAKNLQIPGFRKGKVPKGLAEKNISAGEKYVQAVNEKANDWMRAALEEQDLKPITQPQLDIKNVDDDHVELVYTFTVMPEVKVNDYKNLEYKVEETEVSDEDVDNEINRMRETYTEMEVKEGEAENGDTVNIDYEGFKDGVAFDGGKADGYDLELGSGQFIPGFEDQLIGTKAGDEKNVNLTFPEDYHAEELKGAPVVFKVKVNEVKTKVLPELDDDFAKDLNMPNVETVDDLKKTVRTRLEERKKADATSKADNELLEKLAEATEVDIPDVLIEEEAQNQINQLANQIQQYGMSFSQYLKMMKQDIADLKEQYREGAEKNVRMRLGLSQVAKQENLEPSEDDIQNQLKEIADMYSMEVEKIKSMIDVEMLKDDIRNQKALEFLKGLVK